MYYAPNHSSSRIFLGPLGHWDSPSFIASFLVYALSNLKPYEKHSTKGAIQSKKNQDPNAMSSI